jgi:hypothetical protein
MDIFWVVAPCSLIDVSDISEVLLPPSSGRWVALTMEAASRLHSRTTRATHRLDGGSSTSETSVNFFQTMAQQPRRQPSSKEYISRIQITIAKLCYYSDDHYRMIQTIDSIMHRWPLTHLCTTHKIQYLAMLKHSLTSWDKHIFFKQPRLQVKPKRTIFKYLVCDWLVAAI